MSASDAANRTASDSAKRTPLYETHVRLGASMTDFAGFTMPVRYRSETAEHRAVRTGAGMFDLSHMGEIFISGEKAGAALDYAFVGHLSTMSVGRARYTLMCDPVGGVLDDMIVYRLAARTYLVVPNAANVATIAGALRERASGYDVTVDDQSGSYALIALQGPRAERVLAGLIDADLTGLKYYAIVAADVAGASALVARTGYTGEDGFELFVSAGDATGLWEAIRAAGDAATGAGTTGDEASGDEASGDEASGDEASADAAGAAGAVVPCGLAARDTLRLEAGMALYGNELTRETTPYDAGLGRLVKLDKPGDFVGRKALTALAQTPPGRTLVGLVARGRRVPRPGYDVVTADGTPCGRVTSGAPSPTLGKPIAMAYVDAGQASGGTELAVDIRGRHEPADLTPLPFYRRPTA
jgi:aminomethyltransferase